MSSGVYVAVNKENEVIYVGRSESNVENRAVKSASRFGSDMGKLYIFPCSKASTRWLETRLIAEFNPRCNLDNYGTPDYGTLNAIIEEVTQ